MNIAIFSDTFPPEINGVATSVSMLYRVLKEHGHNVFVITTNPYTKHLMKEGDIFRVPGIKLKKFYGYIFARAYSRKVVKFLKEQKIDLVHINHDFSIGQFGWIVQKQLKCSSVYTYHTMYEDYTYYATKGKIDRFAKWFVRDYFRNISNRCDELIVPSYKCKDYARRIGINKYINVIPTGIDLDMFLNYKLDINKKNEYLKSINIPADSKIVLYLGRLAEEKNIEVLLDHFKDFLDYSKRDDVYFISRRKHKIVLSSVLNERHYKTFNVVQEDIKSTHTIFVDLNGVFAILNKSEDDIRDFYTDCIIDYFVKPGMGKPKSSIRKEIKRQRGETK